MAEHPGFDYGLCNYLLHPEMERQMISTHANNGSAGAECEICLFRWEGTKLQLIRRLVGECRTEHTFANGVFTHTTYPDQLKMTIWDYTSDSYEGEILYEKTTDLNEQIGHELEKAGQLLWEGL